MKAPIETKSGRAGTDDPSAPPALDVHVSRSTPRERRELDAWNMLR